MVQPFQNKKESEFQNIDKKNIGTQFCFVFPFYNQSKPAGIRLLAYHWLTINIILLCGM